jgi:pterin-4a-carbinolamine dehydratase
MSSRGVCVSDLPWVKYLDWECQRVFMYYCVCFHDGTQVGSSQELDSVVELDTHSVANRSTIMQLAISLSSYSDPNSNLSTTHNLSDTEAHHPLLEIEWTAAGLDRNSQFAIRLSGFLDQGL